MSSSSSLSVFVGGSRVLSPAGLALCRSLGASLAGLSSVSSLRVGCSVGADAAFLCGWGSVRGVAGASLFAVGGSSPSGLVGFWSGSAVACVARFAAAGGSVSWWAGGGSRVRVASRLVGRSAAACAGASVGFVVAGSPVAGGSGSWASVRRLVSAGVPCFVFALGGLAPAGFFAGFAGSVVPSSVLSSAFGASCWAVLP